MKCFNEQSFMISFIFLLLERSCPQKGDLQRLSKWQGAHMEGDRLAIGCCSPAIQDSDLPPLAGETTSLLQNMHALLLGVLGVFAYATCQR